MRRVAKTSYFSLEHFLSGNDNERDRLIRAYSGLELIGNYPRLRRGLSTFRVGSVQILIQG